MYASNNKYTILYVQCRFIIFTAFNAMLIAFWHSEISSQDHDNYRCTILVRCIRRVYNLIKILYYNTFEQIRAHEIQVVVQATLFIHCESVIDEDEVEEQFIEMNTVQRVQVMEQVVVSAIDEEECAVEHGEDSKLWVTISTNFRRRFQAMNYTTRSFHYFHSYAVLVVFLTYHEV